MPRRAFVHIGTHKTGTTYLQNWLRLNRHMLRDVGLDFPKIGLWDYGADHQGLSLRARQRKGPLSEDPEWAKLQQFLRQSDRDVIISAETFSEKISTARGAQKIVDFFHALDMTTTFVIYLRDIPAYLNSRYVQEAKNLKLAQGFQSFVADVRNKRDFDYPKLLKPFEQTADVRVLGYAPRGEGLERPFLRAIGRGNVDVDTGAFTAVPRLNQSVGPITIEVARRIAAQLPQNLSEADLKYKQLVFRNLCDAEHLNDAPFVGCDAATADRIRADFADKTETIARRYFDVPWREAVPPERMFERHAACVSEVEQTTCDLDQIVQRVLSAKPGLHGPLMHNLKVLARKLKW